MADRSGALNNDADDRASQAANPQTCSGQIVMKLAVLGASGHTGRMVVDALRQRDVEAIALARSTGGPDVRDQAAVERAIGDADAIVNLAGPFLETGLAAARAAIARGIPYVDTTGEQAFMLRCQRELHKAALDAGVPIVNAMAYEYALGDLAAKAFFPDGGEALHVLYRSHAAGSAGTKKSILRVMGGPTLSFEKGRLRRVQAARYQRTFPTKDGPRTGVSFAGGEILTVPTHTRFATVRTYVATRHAARARRLAPLARLLLHGPVLRAAEAYVDAKHEAPANANARGEIHLLREKEAGGGRREEGGHVVLSMPDPYLVTAHAAAEGAIRLVGAKRAGVLAPAHAYDAREFLEEMARRVPGFVAARFPSSSGARV